MTIYNFNLKLRDPTTNPRKWFPGHVITIGNANARRGNYHKVTTGGARNLLAIQGMQAVQIRWNWNEINPTGSTFDFGPVKSSYADTERSVRSDVWRCSLNNSRLIAMVEDKTFGNPAGPNPVPADLQGNPDYVQFIDTDSSGGDGYCACRWNAVVQARWQAMIQAFGDAFDGNPNFYGIAFQETATGYSQAQRDATGYTDVKYRDALIAMLKKASDAFPTSQVFWYTNFFPTPATDFRIEEVCDALKVYGNGNSGINHGGPDILPDNASIAARVYPRFGDPPDGSFGELKLFCAAQFDSYAHTHATNAPPDNRVPGQTWTSGTLWNMEDIFLYARDQLRVNHVMWENDTTGTQVFDPDARLVIEANPVFNANY